MKSMRNYLILALSLTVILQAGEIIGQNEVTGRVVYHNEEQTPMEGVQVYLKDLGGTVLQTEVSDSIGLFGFPAVETGTYKLTATSGQEPPDVVDLIDVSLLVDYLNGQASLDTLQKLAADVNGDGAIDSGDLDFIMQNWYLNGEDFPVGDWVFEEIVFETGQKEGEDIKGTSIADLYITYEPDKKTGPQYFNYTPVSINAYDKIKMPVRTTNDLPIKNFYIEIAWNKNTIGSIDIEPGIPGLKFSVGDGLVKIIWADMSGKGIGLNLESTLFSLIVKAKNANSINNDDIWLTSNCSFLSAKNKFCDDMGLFISNPIIEKDNKPQFCNYPNPFKSSTVFEYYLQEEGVVSIELLNSNGAITEKMTIGTQQQGPNSYYFANKGFAPGLYFAKLYLDGEAAGATTILIQ